MKAAILGVALAMLLPAQSFGLSLLCVESPGAGFNWANGEWSPATYKGRQHLVKDVAGDPVLAEFCTPEAPAEGEYGIRSKMCLNIVEMGEEPDAMGTAECGVRHNDDGSIMSANCPGLWAEFTFVPNGEFQLTQLHSFVEASPPSERDSLAIFVGKCSVIEP